MVQHDICALLEAYSAQDRHLLLFKITHRILLDRIHTEEFSLIQFFFAQMKKDFRFFFLVHF